MYKSWCHNLKYIKFVFLNAVVNHINMITRISLVFMKLIIWHSFSVKVVNTITAFVKELKFLHFFFLAMGFLNLALYCRLECTATFSVEW